MGKTFLSALGRSFASALAGWVTAIMALPVASFLTERAMYPFSWGYVCATALISAYFVFPVWLCIFWPLYLQVPFSSVLWRPWVCIPCGAMAGALILGAVFPVFMLPLTPLFCVGPLVGAVTCATGCALKHREQSVLAARM